MGFRTIAAVLLSQDFYEARIVARVLRFGIS
jgi:hypothetical protein